MSFAEFEISLGAWLVSRALLVLAHVQRAVPWTRLRRRWVGGCACRRLHNFGQRVCEEHLMCRTSLEACATHLCFHALAGPSTALACCSGRAGTCGGDQPGFVARPLEARRFVARGNWHASIKGCAVTGARTNGDVGGCLVTRGARKWRLEGVGRDEIVRRNVGIRVCGRGG